MKILLYNPDNGVTRNFMPHLWMFLLKALTPPEHEVLLIDGNAKPLNDEQLIEYIKQENIGLVGIGAMTRMVAKAYRVADVIRAAGVPVVMGGPHVTELPDEALGRDGGPRHCDAVALGEADETWPQIVEDAARGQLKEIYEPIDEAGKERKPSLQPYPTIPWEDMELDQFDMIPNFFRPLLDRYGAGWRSVQLIPIESGRGCPYGCEFCTVTGFFGDSIRFRSNESIVEELLRLKRRARKAHGQVMVFFIDDNFAINIKRTKSLLRDMIAANAQLPWLAQISANLLRDEELVDLMAESGCRWVFIGMESIDPVNLADVAKSFNKPNEYAPVLNRLAQRGIYAVTSFIFGLDNDTAGVADRTLVEAVLVRLEAEVEAEDVRSQQDDRRPDRDLVDELRMMRLRRHAEEERGHEHAADGEDELSALRFRREDVEALRLALPAAHEHRRAGDEEEVAEDRAGERCLDHDRQPLLDRHAGDDELRRVAERGVEQSARRSVAKEG